MTKTKFRLRTNVDIESRLIRYSGCARFLWNKTLSMNLERLEKGHGILWYHELVFWLRLWKRSEEYGFLKECPLQVMQQKLMLWIHIISILVIEAGRVWESPCESENHHGSL